MTTEPSDLKPAIEVQHLSAGYNSHAALEDVNFTVEHGCLAGLVGPNGSGKSTLLRVILGLHKPQRGDVRVFGSSGRPDRRRLGYTPQSEQVDWAFPVTLLDVVLMGRYGRLGPLRRPTKAEKRRRDLLNARRRAAGHDPRRNWTGRRS